MKIINKIKIMDLIHSSKPFWNYNILGKYKKFKKYIYVEKIKKIKNQILIITKKLLAEISHDFGRDLK